ncbi:MAG TPA: phosphoglycerate dehydrogenase [Chloroflexota bacterium]|nr:phosphoglycerate dehydrogenase [Chloroflexota bacterium]
MAKPFRVGLTRDFLKTDGTLNLAEAGFAALETTTGLEWTVLDEYRPKLGADQVRDFDALLVLASHVTSETFDGNDQLAVVSRYGVGYDSVDVPACTRNGTLLTITPDGVRRPVAETALCLLLAASHQLLIKDRLTRAGRWAEKMDYVGTGLTGRTLGVIGLGNIGREVITLARPFDLRFLAFDPYVTSEQAQAIGVELVDLETLLRTSDFVTIHCALSESTYHLLNAERLALLKPTAYLINTARGPIVDQTALTAVLQAGRIHGAALDVFEQEPIDPNDPILSLENVIVTPHALCWTDECLVGNGQSAVQNVLDVMQGRIPRYVVNRAALEHPRWRGLLKA